jgi:hypothetical protein
MKNTVIYLIGAPASGKYTVAGEIVARTDARLIDNHLINNVIFAVLRPDGKTKLPDGVWELTAKVGEAVREAAVQLGAADENYIFTNALKQDDALSSRVFEGVLDVATRRQATFVPVRLLCDLEVLQARIDSEDRRQRMKMTDVEGIAKYYRSTRVFNPDHPNKLELDVSTLTASETADAILSHVDRLRE